VARAGAERAPYFPAADVGVGLFMVVTGIGRSTPPIRNKADEDNRSAAVCSCGGKRRLPGAASMTKSCPFGLRRSLINGGLQRLVRRRGAERRAQISGIFLPQAHEQVPCRCAHTVAAFENYASAA